MASASVIRTPRLVLVAIDKGGVGKSFFCIQLIGWLRNRQVNYTAYDPDHANSSLSRFIPEAIFINARHSENLDAMADRLQETPFVLLDGMVGRQGLIFDWMEETNLCSVSREMGFAITLALVLEDDKDAVHQAGEAVKKFGSKVDWLVVKNQKTSVRFAIYDQSRARAELLRCGAREMALPKLSDHLNAFLQRKSITIDDALRLPELTLLDRQRLVQYRRQIYHALEGVQDILV